MGILLVGCGAWGKNWARTLANLGELAAICEPKENLRQAMQAQYPGVPLFESFQTALTSPELGPRIEGVVIASSVVSHVPLAEQCLQAGKPVLVEKPLALTSAEAAHLVRLAEKQRLILAVGHLLMYHPGVLALKSAIEAGRLGEIRSVQCTRYNFGTVRNEENAWWSFACHDLSIVSMLLQDGAGQSLPLKPVSVASMAMLGRPEIPDQVNAVFQGRDGQTASVHVTWLHPIRKREVVVIGSKKMAVLDDFQPDETKVMLLNYDLETLVPDEVGNVRFGALKRGEYSYLLFEPIGDLLAVEAQAFIRAIRAKALVFLPNNGQNGLENVQLLEAVQTMLTQQQQNHFEQVMIKR